ncbi:MAG: hypothetical protein LAP40_02850 [Acidobacteriia bacterium]|nr:hypothetical protein [Terriglobia bacterium]
MERKRKLVVAKAAVLLGAVPIALLAWEYGPEAGHAGVPGELGACNSAGCHVGTALNGGGGSVSISFPNGLSYTPGVKQQLTVTISDPAQKGWGFQATARTASSSTTMAGTFASVDANTQVICSIPSVDPNSIQPVLNFPGSQDCPSGQPLAYIEHSGDPIAKTGYYATLNKTPGSGTYTFTWTPPSTNVGNIVIYVAGNAANGLVDVTGDHIYTKTYTLTPAGALTFSNTYYFPHLALGGGWQTTLTYVNYSKVNVTCQTTFYADSGNPLLVPFNGVTASSRTDLLGPGQSLHQESQAAPASANVGGWAEGQCTGPVKGSLIFRFYSNGKPQGEAGVNAVTAGATEFVTFAQTLTGVTYANPSTTQTATVTIKGQSAAPGPSLGSANVQVLAGAHGSSLVSSALGLASFTGSVQVTSTVPILSLSINAEDFPVFSSLPPGDLPDATPLSSGTGAPTAASGPVTNTYYFPHLALGGGWQTTLTLVNYGQTSVSCQTSFFGDSGAPLAIPFAGAAASATRTDLLGPGQDLHQESQADPNSANVGGWAKAQCTGPVKASLIFRFYSGGTPQGEAGVNAVTAAATEFVTFAQTLTGVTYANPSTTQTATVTITALSATGTVLGSTNVQVAPGVHGSSLVSSALGLASFTGSVQVTSTIPILSLAINAEDFPVFSSLPPGDLADGTPLAGH